MKKMTLLLIKLFGAAILLFIIYLIVVILYAKITDYKPAAIEDVEYFKSSEKLTTITKDTLVFYDWNIGYCGLGNESSFFFDAKDFVSQNIYPKNVQVHPTEAQNKTYYDGFLNTIASWKNDADFITIQEIDKHSARSFYTNQIEGAINILGNYHAAFGKNYDVKFVPMPIFKPMGKVIGGVATFYKYEEAEAAKKYAFPSNFSFPKGLFFLDRCFIKQKFNVKNGKQLIVINTHNSAYDGGTLKKQEMAYFKKFITEEYNKGNYVIVGGDWNQIPPGYTPLKEKSDYEEMPIPTDFIEKNWTFAFDKNTPTNRKVDAKFEAGKTYTTVIDFYLLSPNIELLEVKGQDNGFAFSDHQPVKMSCKLKD